MIDKQKEESGVRVVIWMPRKLHQEIEQTRKRIGYTRSGFYRYTATKAMDQILFTKRQQVKLQPWDEIVGTLKTIETGDETITAVIECCQNLEIALPYQKDTLDASAIQNSTNLLGQKISLLKTDNPEKPIMITRSINTDAKSQLRTKFFVRICRFAKCAIPFNVVFVSLRTRCF